MKGEKPIMANVFFKRGLHSQLKTAAVVDGAFYLTEDTHRLYAGIGSQLVDLNKYIEVVGSLNDLPTENVEAGDFVWVQDKNILAVCTDKVQAAAGGGAGWTQINPDHNDNDNTKVVSEGSAFTVNQGSDKITVSLALAQKTTDIDGEVTDETPIELSFNITKDDLNALVEKAAVDVKASANDGVVSVATSGNGSAGTGFKVKGQGSVSVTTDDDGIVVSGTDTKYDLASAAGKAEITLSGGDKSVDKVTFTAGQQLVASGAEEGNISFAHANIEYTAPTDAAGTLTADRKFTAVDSIVLENGHVKQYKTKTYQIPEDKDTKLASGTAVVDNTGKLSITLKNSDDQEVKVATGQDIYLNVNGNKVYNQGTISFYTKDEINKKFRDIDAVVYRGTVGGSGATVSSLPTTGDNKIANGDMYKVAAPGTYAGQVAKVGDIFIAQGTESNGVISGAISWTYIPSGDDTDTKYELGVANNTISLTNSVDDGVDSATFVAGNDINISTAGTNITIKHEDFAAPAAGADRKVNAVAGGSFTVLDAVVTDNGHVTGYKTATITLPEDKNTTYTLPAAKVTDNASAKITLTGSDSTDEVFFDADRSSNTSLKVNVTGDHITYKHEDYSFTTPANMTAAGTLSAGGKLKVVTGATANNGHITGLTVSEYTLPEDKNYQYTYSDKVESATGGVKITSGLASTGNDASSDAITVTSSSLAVAAAANGAGYTVNMEWGTF